jgi:hypothetical protein
MNDNTTTKSARAPGHFVISTFEHHQHHRWGWLGSNGKEPFISEPEFPTPEAAIANAKETLEWYRDTMDGCFHSLTVEGTSYSVASEMEQLNDAIKKLVDKMIDRVLPCVHPEIRPAIHSCFTSGHAEIVIYDIAFGHVTTAEEVWKRVRIPVIWQHSLHVCNNGRIPAA